MKSGIGPSCTQAGMVVAEAGTSRRENPLCLLNRSLPICLLNRSPLLCNRFFQLAAERDGKLHGGH